MIDQKDFFGSVLMGLGTTRPGTLREMPWGYVVQSVNAGSGLRYVMDRVARFATFAVWLAVIGLWLMPVAMAPGVAFALKSFASVALLGLVYLFVCLTHRMVGYAFHIDTNRREVRVAVLTAKGQSWIKASYRFDEIGAAVMQPGRGADAAYELCLRLTKGEDLIPVAAGDEAALMGIHDRLMRDLRPIEERMAAFGGVHLPVRKQPARPGFPMLGPQEIAVRRRGQMSV